MELTLLFGLCETAFAVGLDIYDIIKTKQIKTKGGLINAKVVELHSYDEIVANNLPYNFNEAYKVAFELAKVQPDGEQATCLACWPVYEINENGRTRRIYSTTRSYAPVGAMEAISLGEKGVNNLGVAGWHSIAMLLLSGGASILISYVLWFVIFGYNSEFFLEFAGSFHLLLFAAGINLFIVLIWWLTNTNKKKGIKAEVVRWDTEYEIEHDDYNNSYIRYKHIPIITYTKNGNHYYKPAPDIGAVGADDKYVMIDDPGRSTSSFVMWNPIALVIAIMMMLFFGLYPLFMG